MINDTLDPSTEHPGYADIARRYHVSLDAFTGNVKDYVPALQGASRSDHEQYLQRAAYFGVVERTTAAIIGAMTRKPFTLTGQFPATEYGSADLFLQYQYRDLLLGGRSAILVDVGTDGKSRLVNYDADDIINWSEDFVMVRETMLVRDAKNPYKLVEETKYREMYLEDDQYLVRLWTQVDGKWRSEDQEQMLVKGKPLSYIPIFPVTPYDNSWDQYNPPLFVQATLNIQHFKQALDQGHFMHFMALPTFVVVGDLAEHEEDMTDYTVAGFATESGRNIVTRRASFKIGSTTEPLHLKEGSTGQWVQIDAGAAAAIQVQLEKIEERMFISGSRLLTTKKGVESVEALQVRAGAEGAVLETITNAVESALNNALELCSQIDGGQVVKIELNKDFSGGAMEPARVKSLLELFTANAISLEQLTAELYDNEVVQQPVTKPV